MTAPAFGLYRTAALTAVQRLQAGDSLTLDLPVSEGGVVLFRASCWLPLPDLAAGTQSLKPAADALLTLRFAPLRFEAGLDDHRWFTEVKRLDESTQRISFAWPATVARVRSPAGGARWIDLLRADGDAVAAQPTQSGHTDGELSPPWVGSPLVVRLGERFEVRKAFGPAKSSAPRAAVTSPVGTEPIEAGDRVATRFFSNDVPALVLAGTPTSPRLKLFAEGPGPAPTLLWQSLLSGEQGTVDLPAKPIAEEWADAFQRLLGLLNGKPEQRPTGLRLDVESDAPCRVALLQLALALESEVELLNEAWTASFDGSQPEDKALPIALAAGSSARGLSLRGRVVADAAAGADGGSGPADARLGALLAADESALQPLDLAQPASLAGFALRWQPLSDHVRLRLRLRADGVNGPAARVLAEAESRVDTQGLTWLALRWPALDLQAQRVWLEATVLDGLGLWLFSDADGPPGFTEVAGTPAQRSPLPRTLAFTAAAAPGAGSGAARAIAVRVGSRTLAAALPAGALALTVPADALGPLATQPLVFSGGVRGSVTVDAARLVTRIGG